MSNLKHNWISQQSESSKLYTTNIGGKKKQGQKGKRNGILLENYLLTFLSQKTESRYN